jgi:hypothetical protein
MMATIKLIQTGIILPTGKAFLIIFLFYARFFLFYFTICNFIQHINGFFSLASIKKPPMILINKPVSMVILLTKTKNGMQR